MIRNKMKQLYLVWNDAGECLAYVWYLSNALSVIRREIQEIHNGESLYLDMVARIPKLWITPNRDMTMEFGLYRKWERIPVEDYSLMWIVDLSIATFHNEHELLMAEDFLRMCDVKINSETERQCRMKADAFLTWEKITSDWRQK